MARGWLQGRQDGRGEGTDEIGFELAGVGGFSGSDGLALAGSLRGGVTLEVGDLAVGADDEGEVARGGAGEARRGGEQALWLAGGGCGVGLS